MCGIAGIISQDSTALRTLALERMTEALSHRGPDEHGLHIEGSAALGHARLSIIDLAGGHQPMQLHDGRMWTTFNGEIFNYIELRQELEQKGHKFVTKSDTEVILHLYQEYGTDFVQRMNGQWALAIWDDARKQLFLSRDRMGIRPLYYTTVGGALIFASEIKAILAHPRVPRQLDLQALDQIFTFWCPLPSRTTFKNIHQLPPGHSGIFKDGHLKTWRYWKLNYEWQTDESPRAVERAADQLFELLLDAARIRLRADVPVGAYLSGGLDSAVTTALITRLVPENLRTFSVGFEDADLDESVWQREAASFFGVGHESIRCSAEDIGEVFPDVIWHMEQPVLRTAPAPLYILSRLVRESGFKVVLTGEGSDEILGGYDIFKEAKVRRFIARNIDSKFRPLLLRRLYPYIGNIQKQSPAYLQRFFHVNPSDVENPFFSHIPRWTLTARAKTFFSDDVRQELGGYDCLSDMRSELPTEFSRWDGFSQAQYLETAHLLPNYILSAQGDRVAMAHSVEGRYPFLDYRVVEFASHLSPALKMKALDEKYLLKRMAKGLVPESILSRPKQPYRAPDGRSFVHGKAREYVDEILSAETIRNAGIFKPEPVRMLLEKFRSGRPTNTGDDMALVGILSTSLLMDQFIYQNRKQDCACTTYSESFATLS
ncbi:MAG TPA: asparagine synthase (glutamine-hydrolyzing) [Pseudacidobacterium sp.]|nr:asparagine synthase (glutamine-hydrolyzing) [Pseudacidobacterium sp.]